MLTKDRHERIVALVEERGFLSVTELSHQCSVSEMTIRRDLGILDQAHRIQRTFGGAASLRTNQPNGFQPNGSQLSTRTGSSLVDRVDVLIATSVSPSYDNLLLESIAKRNIPIIAESLSMQGEETVVAVDNYQAGYAIGKWAGEYANKHWGGSAEVLDLTFILANTQLRSHGFIAGLRETAPNAEIVHSINAQSRYAISYQLTRDVLTVNKNINIIFGINDTIALGAIRACKDLNIDPDKMIVITFGLEGDSMKDLLMEGGYCKAGLAMFPEIVAPTCVEAAIAAYNHQRLPRQLISPHAILTPETLCDFYEHTEHGWELRWDAVHDKLELPIDISLNNLRTFSNLPHRIGFIIPFSEHEWYKKLTTLIQEYVSKLKIEFEIVDVDQTTKNEVDSRRREIARAAAEQIHPNDVIMIDGGPIANYLAEMLINKEQITVITNSVPVFDILTNNPDITLISTGGAYRHSSQMLVGPPAEGALRELRADKLFLMVTGISLDFGLSHTNISEVTLKQNMIHSAREVILLADHSYFGQESIVQVAPLTVVNKLITDDALPASLRLELTKLGLQIILANV
jgi:DeoR/GlpR family transcriptional regulator of sugar metabolism/ABC-type sugar transport system substrate-binding protein